MVRFFVASLALCACLVVCVTSAPRFPSAHPRIHAQYWRTVRPLSDRDSVQLSVFLRQQNLGKLFSFVEDVSNPESPNYASYMSLEELRGLVAPSKSAVDVVTEWFSSNGASEVLVSRSWDALTVRMPAHKAEDAFGVKLFEFRHVRSNRVLYRAKTAYTMPEHVASRIELITGLTDFFDMPAERRVLPRTDRPMQDMRPADPAMVTSAKSKAATNTSAPDIRRVHGGPYGFRASVALFCSDGSPTADATNPCSDHPPAITEVTFEWTSRGFNTQTKTLAIADLTCAAAPSPVNPGMEVVCNTPTLHMAKLRRTTITATSVYSGGSTSDLGKYAVDYASSPYIMPRVIQKQYQVPLGLRATNASNSQSVVGFEKQYISISNDLKTFFADMGMPFMTPNVHGTNNESSPGGESTLDIQYVMGVGAGVPTTFWSVSGNVGHGGYILEWALQIGNTTSPPLVTSISYGDTELGYFNKFGSWQYIDRMNAELAKMAARGLTVMAGSGDAGCTNVGEMGNDLSPTDPTCTSFRPFFPSNSPYVLSVSATFLSPNALPMCSESVFESIDVQCEQLGEVAVSVSQGIYWTTGGGFSNRTKTQSWQASAVANYLSTQAGKLPPSNLFNSQGRGYPDVSALGYNLLVVWGGRIVPIGGTSASGPVMAGLVSLINDARLNAGKKPMGLLNPWLYKVAAEHPSAFNDITVGRNADGDLQPRGSKYPTTCPNGFNTSPDWDPVTGLGTPHWDVLRDLALQLP